MHPLIHSCREHRDKEEKKTPNMGSPARPWPEVLGTHTFTHTHTHTHTCTHTNTRKQTNTQTHTHTNAGTKRRKRHQTWALPRGPGQRCSGRTHSHPCTHPRTHTHTHFLSLSFSLSLSLSHTHTHTQTQGQRGEKDTEHGLSSAARARSARNAPFVDAEPQGLSTPGLVIKKHQTILQVQS